MIIAKQIEIRNSIKKFFDIAYEGDPVIVPRKDNKNVVIISEKEYARLNQAKRLDSYARAFEHDVYTSQGDHTEVGQSVKDDNIEKLRVIGDLKDNWNQNGATAFSGKLIRKVRNVLDKITVQPEIFPTALGTIQLEFDNSRRDHMEIEIGESGDAEVFVSMYSRKEYFETISATPDAINKKVGEFYG